MTTPTAVLEKYSFPESPRWREGRIWEAEVRAVRVRPGGEIVRCVDAGTGVYACALGGDDGHTLFLCTAPGFAEHERRDTREAALLSVRVEIPAV
ncbi:MAG: SMP-30/gluconolactonase/LRE family protein [Pseudonocardia sp.]|nr:SMP-30/gluconolactonase/LRE family protein [Pseudonocardia sp.]